MTQLHNTHTSLFVLLGKWHVNVPNRETRHYLPSQRCAWVSVNKGHTDALLD